MWLRIAPELSLKQLVVCLTIGLVTDVGNIHHHVSRTGQIFFATSYICQKTISIYFFRQKK